jgi:glycosyltransferase involved in cell wall biosynthesis
VEWLECALKPLPRAATLADQAYHRLFSRKRFIMTDTFLYSKNAARALEDRLRGSSCDLLFAPKGSTEIAFLRSSIPIIYHSDATFELLSGYYQPYVNLSRRVLEQGDAIERKALEKARHVILLTDWARRSAVDYYGIPDSKISVIPSGADLAREPAKDLLRFHRNEPPCELLFVGLNWEEKGGPTAFHAMQTLNRTGLATNLTVVGCRPPSSFESERMTTIPFLDKSRKNDSARLEGLFLEADFLIAPSRAECAGIVFCEASAFALPSIASDTGGIAGHVENEINGMRLPEEDTGEGYARTIRDLWDNPDRCAALRRSSRRKYESDLNWKVWGERVRRVVESVLA